jgi:hypothetical protein
MAVPSLPMKKVNCGDRMKLLDFSSAILTYEQNLRLESWRHFARKFVMSSRELGVGSQFLIPINLQTRDLKR